MKCIIPARKGSKRIPNKNFKDFMGKPLFTYSVATAWDAKFSEVIVTTDADIEEGDFTVHKRPPVSDEETLHEVWELFEEPFCCLLPNPLTKFEDLMAARRIAELGFDVWSVKEGEYNNYEDAGQFYFKVGGPKVLYKVYDSVDINTPEDWEEAYEVFNNRRNRELRDSSC